VHGQTNRKARVEGGGGSLACDRLESDSTRAWVSVQKSKRICGSKRQREEGQRGSLAAELAISKEFQQGYPALCLEKKRGVGKIRWST